MRVLLIHNPQAGHEQADADHLLGLIRAQGHEPIYQSAEIDDLGAALAQPADLIVAAGGDGTATRVLKRAAGAGNRTPIAMLPLGTANNVAYALGHVGTLEDLVRAWPAAEAAPIDLGIVSGPWGRAMFGESFGIGALPETMVRPSRRGADTDHATYKTVLERMDAALKSLRKAIRDLRPAPMTITTAAGTVSGDYLWAEVSNVGMVGPRIPLAETDDISDGLLAFAALPADERDTFLEYLDHRVAGSAPTRTGLASERVARLTLRWEGFESHLDGKLISSVLGGPKGTQEVELRAAPGAAMVLRLPRRP